jgi:hypothetical protein
VAGQSGPHLDAVSFTQCQWPRQPDATDAVGGAGTATWRQVFHVSEYVTKFRLPPHPCDRYIWRANIFFDKTGSEMTRNLIAERHATLAGQEPLGRTLMQYRSVKARHTHRRFDVSGTTKFQAPPLPPPMKCTSHLESQYLL